MLGHVALALIPGFGGVAVGLAPDRAGQRRGQGQRDLAGRLALRATTTSVATPGFSLFYMGINIGALVGPLLTGLLQDTKGFH